MRKGGWQHRNQNTKAKKRMYDEKVSVISKKLGDDVRGATEDYLDGKQDEALVKLAVLLNQPNLNKIKPFLKKSIHTYVKHFRKDFDGSIEIKNCVYDLFLNFDMTEFMQRKWQHRPYHLKKEDYAKMQTIRKNPVYVQNYDYTQPIYKLANNIDYQPEELKLHKSPLETVKNDVKFYLSSDENIVFAKMINLKYRPNNLKMVKAHIREKVEEKETVVYDKDLYSRSLSVAMYVLLEGDPNKAVPFMRYDNDNLEDVPSSHVNLYIGDDPRKRVYKKDAKGPHFHFQNEDDSLLCLRKYREDDGKTKYRIGRCNAIDCESLKYYLLTLDSSYSQQELDKMLKQKLHYNMPFLQYKCERKMTGENPDNIFYKFIQNKTDEEINHLEEVSLWLTTTKYAPIYNRGGEFDKLIRALDLLQIINNVRNSAIDYDQRKILSQLEIAVADSVVNSICNNSSKCLEKSQTPKFKIQTDLLQKDEKECQ